MNGSSSIDSSSNIDSSCSSSTHQDPPHSMPLALSLLNSSTSQHNQHTESAKRSIYKVPTARLQAVQSQQQQQHVAHHCDCAGYFRRFRSGAFGAVDSSVVPRSSSSCSLTAVQPLLGLLSAAALHSALSAASCSVALGPT